MNQDVVVSRSMVPRSRILAYMALFTALISIGAYIRIPTPVVPFTLQLLFTTLAGLVMGARKGAGAVLVYVALGLLGVPVFTDGGGFSYVFQPTFGYLVGFAGGACAAGALAGACAVWTWKRLAAAVFVNLLIVYACGAAYTYLISECYIGAGKGIWALFTYSFLVGIPGDMVLCLAAVTIARRLAAAGLVLHRGGI